MSLSASKTLLHECDSFVEHHYSGFSDGETPHLMATHQQIEDMVLDTFESKLEEFKGFALTGFAPLSSVLEPQGELKLTWHLPQGVSLSQLLERFPVGLEPQLAAYVALNLVSRLALAERQYPGLRHGHLMPHRIWLDASGQTTVAGLGIDLLLMENSKPTPTSCSRRWFYTAPEQIRGEGGDQGADTFAMGVILYELLTGTLPFGNESPYRSAIDIRLGRFRPLTESQSSLPPGLAALVHQMLARQVEERPNWTYLRDRLRAYVEDIDTTQLRLSVEVQGMQDGDFETHVYTPAPDELSQTEELDTERHALVAPPEESLGSDASEDEGNAEFEAAPMTVLYQRPQRPEPRSTHHSAPLSPLAIRDKSFMPPRNEPPDFMVTPRGGDTEFLCLPSHTQWSSKGALTARPSAIKSVMLRTMKWLERQDPLRIALIICSNVLIAMAILAFTH